MIAVGAVAFITLTGCVAVTSARPSDSSGTPKIIKIAVPSDDAPKAYVDSDGSTITGYDVEALKAADALLDQYTFEFTAVDFDAMLVGLGSGTYDIASDSLLKTTPRAEKYLYASEPIGFTSAGLVMRSNQQGVSTLADVARLGLREVPLPATTGTYAYVTQYNTEHPDAQVNLGTIDSLSRADAYTWLVQGKYDVYFTTVDGHATTAAKLGYTNTLKVSDSLISLPTYPLFRKDETQLADAVSSALATLRQNGTLSRLSQQFFGNDIFANNN